MDGIKLWGGSLGVRREGGSGKDRGEIHKVGTEGRWKDTRIHGKGGDTEGEDEMQGRKEGVGI